ncbi:MAG: hypothetical protein ACM3O3_11025 [Syntrophothermus sp.]
MVKLKNYFLLFVCGFSFAGLVYGHTGAVMEKIKPSSRYLSDTLETSEPTEVDTCSIEYENAPLDYHNSLSAKDKLEIYLVILGERDHFLVRDSLFNNTSSRYEDDKDKESRKDKIFSIPFEEEVKQGIIKNWEKKNLDSRFVSDTKAYTVASDGSIKEPYWEVWLGPIKLIHGKIIVGFESYSGPLAAKSFKYLLKKKKGKWKLNIWGPFTVS